MIRYGEIHLKGLNRPYFESLLKKRIVSALKEFECRVERGDGRYFVYGVSETEAAINKLKKVFGVHSISPVLATEKTMENIYATCVQSMAETLAFDHIKTFKVESKRSDKRFPLKSPELSREVGGHILQHFPELSVNVVEPDCKLFVEVRDKVYIYTRSVPGQGGMPTGCAGKVTLLLSGGIDSPVAGYMCAKRGVELSCVHFHSFPFTGEQSKQKVLDLAKLLSEYVGSFSLHVVHFTDIQQEIYKKCPHEELTIIMRRYMMDIASRIAKKTGGQALVTGESIGQVASQTLESLGCTDAAVDMPVFRPLIGMDKVEIIDIARRIGTFETSILPFEDCCTIFVAKHPKTKPNLEAIVESEKVLDKEALIADALEKTEVIRIKP